METIVETPVVPQTETPVVTTNENIVVPQRGRAPSEQTVAIRAMLDMDPTLTWKKAKPQFRGILLSVTQTQFNGIKQAWKDHNKPANIKFTPDNVSVEEALAFVEEAGGLANAKNMVNHYLALINTLEKLQTLLNAA